MREIKFRAWDRVDNWLGEVTSIDFDEEAVFIETRTIDDENRFKFDEIELMQYTGLKDKNGTELYFDDCINFIYGKNRNSSISNIRDLSDLAYLIYEIHECGASFEIIGNIHENRELSEEAK